VTDCIFCAILRGEAPGNLFYAADVVVGLLDINPVTEGHALLIPRRQPVRAEVAVGAPSVVLALVLRG
jgi:histidine triad (HIT) family protein